MGSPVSVAVANLVMEDVEQRALNTFTGIRPRFWKIYVDDTFTDLAEDQLQSFHDHLNSIEGCICFTFEVETNGCLPFLDVSVRHEPNGQLFTCTSVYRKKTHTDNYLNFNSHHQLGHKNSVVTTLMIRAERLAIFVKG